MDPRDTLNQLFKAAVGAAEWRLARFGTVHRQSGHRAQLRQDKDDAPGATGRTRGGNRQPTGSGGFSKSDRGLWSASEPLSNAGGFRGGLFRCWRRRRRGSNRPGRARPRHPARRRVWPDRELCIRQSFGRACVGSRGCQRQTSASCTVGDVGRAWGPSAAPGGNNRLPVATFLLVIPQ